MSPHARRPETPRSGFLRRRLILGTLMCAAAVLLVSCDIDMSGVEWPAPDPDSMVSVRVRNSTTADFYVHEYRNSSSLCCGFQVPVGTGGSVYFWQSNAVLGPSMFEIARGGTKVLDAVPLARVNLRVLKYPEASVPHTTVDVTVTITEPRAGVFEATTLDTTWIEILSVVPLPY